MSKVSFRARALDSSKPMPVFRAEEIPDLPDFATINRSVPQMPTGMEKEEESEHHLQRALSAQQVYGTAEALVIPIPEVVQVSDKYETYYKEDFKPTKQYIHVQAFNMEQEIPDYDMDSEDEAWLNEQAKKMEITPLKFEEMLDRLEKGSGQQVVTLQEAKLLLKEDDDLIIAVYDYWLNKRLRTQHPLILQVKTEKRDGSTTNNPYVAFRRRTEKMQTRKNRKNDEASYEKMLKLRRDLYRAVTLLEMIKRREKTKKEMLQLTIEILEKRYQLEDFHGQLLADAEAQKHSRPSYISPYSVNRQGEWVDSVNGEESLQNNKKRIYRKRKHRQIAQQQGASLGSSQTGHFNDVVDSLQPDIYSSDEEGLSPGMSPSDHEDENDPDGQFAFRRKKHCNYYAPMVGRLGNWPWCGPDEGGLTDKRFRFSLMSLPPPHNCISYARRRVGRGGRMLVDRAFTPQNAILEQLDLSSSNTATGIHRDYITYIRERKIPHYTWSRQVKEESRSPCSSAETARTTTTAAAAASSSTAATPTTNSACTTEFNFESFQNHREEILLMQQKQRQRLESSEADNFQTPDQHSTSSSNHSSSHLTLDSASAKFAVSAVRDTTQLQNSSGANFHSSSTSFSSLSNGPITQCKDNQFGTGQPAAVLQLNLNPPSHSSDPHLPSGLVSSSVVPALNNMTSSKVITSSSSSSSSSSTSSSSSSSKSAFPVLKLSAANNTTTTTTTALESFKKQTYEDGSLLSNYSKDRIVPMDVT